MSSGEKAEKNSFYLIKYIFTVQEIFCNDNFRTFTDFVFLSNQGINSKLSMNLLKIRGEGVFVIVI